VTVQKRTAIITKKKNKRQGTKMKLELSESSSKEDSCYLVCAERYKTAEGQVQCMKCELWSHVACSRYDTHYVRIDCGDDSD
jgi:hypothetical protein